MHPAARDNGTVWVGKLAVLLFGLGFTWAAAASVHLLTSAPYLGTVLEAAGTPDPAIGRINVTLASANGAWTLSLLSLITVLFGLPFGVALTHPGGQRFVGWTIGLLLVAFSVVTGSSVGLTYLPAALLVIAAAALSPTREHVRPEDPGLASSDSL